MVRSYTDAQLLKKVKSLPTFKKIPSDYWILGIQSDEDAFNVFDDKFYLFKGEKFIMVVTGTTNAGAEGHLNYKKYNPGGVAVIKTNEWYYDVWRYGLHKSKMEALRQIRPIKFYRDNDRDGKTEEVGKLYNEIIYANFHTVSYDKRKGYILKLIGGWSVACQVCNNVEEYYKIIALTKNQNAVSYCLLKEFTP